jgi:two-component system response regulator AtoC
MRAKVLIVDDEPGICVSLSLALQSNYDVFWEVDPQKALERIDTESFHLVLLDLVLGETDGLNVLARIKERDPRIIVIVMTAFGSIRSSVAAMRQGAFTYLSKPLDLEELQIYIRQALEFQSLNEKITYLNSELKTHNICKEMIGQSPVMQTVYRMIEKLRDLDTSVLITGESGTGKELVSKAIHYSGARADERFVAVNCAAIPEGLLEEEFFGHKRGAFTGAISDTRGKFELADKGTLFLDEIGDMPLLLQSKLLRVLQERRFSPIGSNETFSCDARIIVATNRDLREMVQKGLFREDLYYRINVFEIKLPPLRDRRQDIPLLCEHFIKVNNMQQKKQVKVKGVTKEAEQVLLAHDYPGNVRELANALEYACIVTPDEWIHKTDLPSRMWEKRAAGARQPNGAPLAASAKTLREIERSAILDSYRRHGGKKKAMAQELGISERGLWNKLKEYGLQ